MAKELQSLNTGFQDVLLLDEDNSPFDYKGFHAVSHYSQDHIDMDPTYTPANVFNNKVEFKLPRGDYHVGKIQLTFEITALAKTTGTYVRLHDFGAYHMIDYIEAKLGNNEVIRPRIELDDLLVRYWKDFDDKEREHVDYNIGGNLSALERNARGAAVQYFLIELPLWWTGHPDMYLNCSNLARDIDMYVRFKDLPSCVQTDAVAPTTDVTCTMSNVKLRVFHYTQPEHILKRQTMKFNTTIKGQEEGQIKKCMLTEKLTNIPMAAASGTEYTIKIDSIKGNVVEWWFIIRTATNISAGTANQDYLTWQDIDGWELYDGQNLIIRRIDSEYNRFYLFPHWHDAPPGNYMFGYSYSMSPSNELNSTGHLNHGSFKDPKLKIYLKAPLASSARFDMFAFSHQLVQQKDKSIKLLLE